LEKVKTKSIGFDKEKVHIIHVKVIGGNASDIFTIGEEMKKFAETLPFKLQAIVSNDNVQLQDVDTLLRELYKLKKEMEKQVEESGDSNMSNMSK